MRARTLFLFHFYVRYHVQYVRIPRYTLFTLAWIVYGTALYPELLHGVAVLVIFPYPEVLFLYLPVQQQGRSQQGE